jgi:hypothetical protein
MRRRVSISSPLACEAPVHEREIISFVLEVWEIAASSPPSRETHPDPGHMPISLISDRGVDFAGVFAPSGFNALNQLTRTLSACSGSLPHCVSSQTDQHRPARADDACDLNLRLIRAIRDAIRMIVGENATRPQSYHIFFPVTASYFPIFSTDQILAPWCNLKKAPLRLRPMQLE